MNKELKNAIKTEVKNIVEEIELEESEFNRMFHSNVQFQRSYYKFKVILDKYGKESYLKYVPFKYRKLEIKSLILDKNYVEIYEHYGMNTIKKLAYTHNIYQKEIKATNKFKLLILKLKKLFSSNFISLPSQTVLMLPENIDENINNLENTIIE